MTGKLTLGDIHTLLWGQKKKICVLCFKIPILTNTDACLSGHILYISIVPGYVSF